MPKVSVIMTSWKRFANLERIIDAWLGEPEVDEVILWNNGQCFKTDKPIITIKSSHNFGSSARYALGALVKNEIVMFGDDDIMPQRGFLADMVPHFKPDRLLGVTGRVFHGSYQKHTVIDAKSIKQPSRVEFLVGYLMMIHQKNLLGLNYRFSPWHCCELDLQGRLKGKIELYVIPTQKWQKLPEGEDENALFLQPKANAEKEKVWAKYFR